MIFLDDNHCLLQLPLHRISEKSNNRKTKEKAAYYNGKRDDSYGKSVVMINESKNRLERARFQYENLLLHAGNALLLSSTPPRSLSNSPQYSKFTNSKLKSPQSGDFQQNALLKEDFLQSHPKNISPISYKGINRKNKINYLEIIVFVRIK